MEAQIIIEWYLAFLAFGLIGLAVGRKFFTNWADRGYGISKFLGLLVAALPLWFLASLKILPFNRTTVIIIVLALTVWAVFSLYKSGFKILKLMLLEEAIFLCLFLFWCAVRSTSSQIEGTEKFMNLAFMNIINRSEYLPPPDPWYVGGTINYYYLGHYLFVFASKIFDIAQAYAYNLAMTTIIAYAFIASFSIILQLTAGNEKKRKWAIIIAILGATWLCFGGNLHYFSRWLTALLEGQKFTYWFPDGTRIIPYAIDEFPAYSIVLADLHGHYLGMPFMIMFLSFLVISFGIKFNTISKLKFNLLLSLPLAALYGINTWDFITINFLFLLLHLYQFYVMKGTIKARLTTLFLNEVCLLLPGLLFMAPYFLNFKPAIGGLGIVPVNAPRDFGAWLLMWGMFLIISIVAVICMFILNRIKKISLRAQLQRLIKVNDPAILVGIFNIVVLALIIGVEIFYVRDIFEKDNGVYFRTNTVFKFYFAAWSIWVIVCSYWVYALFKRITATPFKHAFKLMAVSVIIILIPYLGCIAYISKAISDFYPFMKYPDGTSLSFEKIINGKEGLKIYGTLDGNNYIATGHSADYQAITWINKNIQGTPVIAEAVGEAYTYYSRISTNTGLQTVIGWPTHEWQWRDTVTEIYDRKDDVAKLYTTNDDQVFKTLLSTYRVQYIFIGAKERETYSNLNEPLIAKNMIKIYDQENTRIYQRKD